MGKNNQWHENKEREAYEKFIKNRFGNLIDRCRSKNGDGEYLAWDMLVGWQVWKQARKEAIAGNKLIQSDNASTTDTAKL